MSLCRHESEDFMTQIIRPDYAMGNHDSRGKCYFAILWPLAWDFWNAGVSAVTEYGGNKVWLKAIDNRLVYLYNIEPNPLALTQVINILLGE